MDAPQTAVWGPNLWQILHAAAERIGTRPSRTEDTRLWSALLSSLRFSLPCPLCKKHYAMYYARNRPNPSAIPAWLWGLHVDVNRRLGRADGLGRELLTTVYGQPFQLTKHWAIVWEHMLRAVRMGWCVREDIQRTARIIEEMRRWYDFF